ncbi:major facilitator superfamily domain-containing protein [Phlebopus sp. FC_14]|nr:major facilitator superfamily domain-containing protein [Phlebopus sp. FC_14]
MSCFSTSPKNVHPEVEDASNDRELQVISPARAFFIRSLALLCACSLSVGSHYASYTLGPLKSRLARELGTSNTEFSLLISAFSLNSTWTPLIGGIMASKLGTTITSIFATGVVFLGQVMLLLGETHENVRLMAFGLFVFGLGVSPLAVVQESIIVRFFKSHGLGVSMALGLVAGKCSSFVSARTSYPLSERFGRHAPFYASAALTGLSFLINIFYMSASKWLIHGSGTILEASEVRNEARRRAVYSLSEAKALEKVARKRSIKLRDIPLLGDVFWAYIGLNILCGMIWSPFTHLAANILQKRYNLTEDHAGAQASYLLAGSMILYPASGYLVDRLKHPQTIVRMFLLSSILTMLCYAWLAGPPQWTQTPFPGIISFASGIGFSPLLLVVIVPTLVPIQYVSTTLGVHKSLEQTGSTILQTLAGLWLDTPKQRFLDGDDAFSIQYLLNAFLLLNILQFISLFALGHVDRRRKGRDQLPYCPEDLVQNMQPDLSSPIAEDPSPPSVDPRKPLLTRPVAAISAYDLTAWDPRHGVCRRSEMRRGRIFAFLCAVLICSAWVLFLTIAWLRLRSKEDRGVTGDLHIVYVM